MIHMTMNYTFECEIQNPVKYISKYSIIIKFLNVLFYFADFLFFNLYLLIFRVRERGKEREREKHQFVIPVITRSLADCFLSVP